MRRQQDGSRQRPAAPVPPGGRSIPEQARRSRGQMSHESGLSAEEQVARLYLRRGLELAAKRWRGKGGEIDLIFRDGDGLVFVEVKRAATHDRAIARISPSQVVRLFAAAEEFAGSEPAGSLTEMRFDAALVDGTGHIAVLENAFL